MPDEAIPRFEEPWGWGDVPALLLLPLLFGFFAAALTGVALHDSPRGLQDGAVVIAFAAAASAAVALIVRVKRQSLLRTFGLRLPSLGALAWVPVVVLADNHGGGFVFRAMGGVSEHHGGPVVAAGQVWDPLEVLVMVLSAPVFEELFFRGALWTAVEQAGGRWVALVFTSAFFAAVHGLHPTVLAVSFVGGALFGALRMGSGSIWPGVLAHALHNGLLVRWLLTTPPA